MTEEVSTVPEVRFFSWADYTVFGAMLLVSAGIGVYHGCSGRFRRGINKSTGPTRSESGEFLTANGQMGTVPVALSMLAGFLSSITLMGQPAEVYLFGPQLWLFGLASFLCIPVIGYIFIPFYHKMQFTSAYEYFGQRFNRWLQLFASTMFSIQMVLYLALVLYAPALALHQVTGLNTNAVVTVMYVVVIFYTTIGGMKAVVWTDCFQVLILYSSMLAVLIKGTLDIGGISTVWERNLKTGRSDFFNWDFDPTERYTLWASFIGAGVLHISVYGANQLQVQRYRTVATVGQARKMMWINTFGWTIVVVLTVYAGMLIFARYYDCDPLASGILSKPDQLFPLYVMDTLGDYVGFPGLFVAGIFSAGLSTVSTGLNSLAAIWWAEMNGTSLKQCALVRKSGGLSVKFLAFAFGLLSYALVYVVPYMGGLAPVAISLSSFFSGSFLGLFILGIFVPWANTAGAAAGLTVGIFGVGWLTVGGQIMSDKGQAIFTPLPVSTAGCSINATILDGPSKPVEMAFVLYRVSFLWYSLLSLILTVGVGVLVSLLYTWLYGKNVSKESVLQNSPVFRPSPDNLNMRASQGACKLLFKEATIEEKSAEEKNHGIDNMGFVSDAKNYNEIFENSKNNNIVNSNSIASPRDL